VTHGFNNLLMVIHGSAEALCRRVPLTDKAKLYADVITPRAGIADRGQEGGSGSGDSAGALPSDRDGSAAVTSMDRALTASWCVE
jgi:hypothetical protein